MVLETCAELVGVPELAQPLLWCESRELAVAAGVDILVPFLAVDAGLLALDVSRAMLNNTVLRALGATGNTTLQRLAVREVPLDVQLLRTAAELNCTMWIMTTSL